MELRDKKAEQAMKEEVANGDTEIAHSNADDILCDLLMRLGYTRLVSLYHDVAKWYA